MLNVEKLKVRKRDNMKKNERNLESEKMLNIIHENHKKAYNKVQNEEKSRDKRFKILMVGLISIAIIGCVILTNDRKEAINNCMKNNSETYCTKISG